MRVQITTRNCEVPQDVQARATSLIEKLEKFEPGILSADLVFREDRHQKELDCRLSVARSEPVVASASGDDFLSAADELADKLSKILRRRRSQIRDRARAGAGETSED